MQLTNASIYFVRLALTTYYEYRTSLVQSHLDDLQSQRDGQVEKLKIATKYNSTQELLKKYGGTPTPKSKSATNSDRKVSPKQSGPSGTQGGRTGFVPPPTANIPGRNLPPTGANTPQNSTPQIRVPAAPLTSPPRQAPMSPRDLTADFAPNAFSASPQYAQTTEDSRWYDRIMDVLLGEDETLPAKRLALICGHCRLVNGQAPPGLKRLEDVGKWRCWGCRAMNGEETEAAGLVAGIKEQAASTEEDPRTKEPTDPELGKTITNEEADSASADGEESDVTQYSSRDSEIEKETGKPKTLPKPVVESETPRRRSTRPKKSSKETE